MKKNLKNILTFIVGWPLSFLALFYIIKTFLPKTNEILKNISSMNPWFLGIGVVCFLTYYLIRGIIWHEITKEQGYTLSLRKTAFLWSTSEFKRYIPGNVWSFFGRTFLFSEEGMSKKDIAKGLVIEMQIVLLGSIFASVLSLPFLVKYIFPFLQTVPYIKVLASFLIITCIVLYMHADSVVRYLPVKFQIIVCHVLPTFSPMRRLVLLFLSAISFFFFGLGYYFSISAVTFLHPQQLFILTGFFVFSLLVGLLSFITPTGLGVREGAITFGLSQIIPLSLAGFASIFGRTILIISETIFLFLIYGISKIKTKKIERLFQYIDNHKPETVLCLFIASFIFYFSTISILRHDYFYTGRFDLGNMDQTVWNTLHGRIFQFTNPDGVENISRLAFHADFLLILLTPFYLIWQDPRMLLIIQASIVGIGAVFVYLLSRDLLRNKPIALSLAFAYLLNPSIQRATIYDFHAVTLVTTFLLGAFYFIYKKRYGWFIVFAVLSGITKEQIWLIIALLGLYILVKNATDRISIRELKSSDRLKHIREEFVKSLKTKQSFLGLSVFLISVVLFYSLIWHVIPRAAGSSQHFALSYFEDEESPSDIIKNMFLSPQTTIEKISDKPRRTYVKQLLLPVGYLPLGAPWVFVFPSADIALNVLSDKPQLHQIYYQYTAAISPFLFIGAIYTLYYITKLFPVLPKHVITCYILAMALYGAYLYSPLPGSKEPNLSMLTEQSKDAAYIKLALSSIDARYSVAASNNLGAHLTHREYLFTIPRGVDKADVLVFDTSGSWNQPSNEWHKEKIAELRSNPDYAIWYEKDGFVVFKKIVKGNKAEL